MSKLSINKTVEIKAPVSKVWKLFTDPVLTRQMGGEYVSDWQVGSSFSWKGLDGKLYTNSAIVNIIPEKLLRHNNFKLEDTERKGEIISIITYEFKEENRKTTISTTEDFPEPLSDELYSDLSNGWNIVLMEIKQMAEKGKL